MSTKRIYLLGSRGMLGQMVQRYFSRSESWQLVHVEARFDPSNLIDYFRGYDDAEPAVFINGVGAIPQKVSEARDFVLPNVLLPLELARTLAPQHLLIHPSTDCVFKGDRGQPYPAIASPDATDAYGWSKLQAERVLLQRPNTVVLRTSIIGPSESASSGLLQWFLSQPERAVLQGFRNHWWNGLTTLQWCVEVERLLGEQAGTARLLQLGTTQSYSKYDMLCLFRDTFRPDITVNAVEHGSTVDRRLLPQREVPPLPQQLRDLSTWLDAL